MQIEKPESDIGTTVQCLNQDKSSRIFVVAPTPELFDFLREPGQQGWVLLTPRPRLWTAGVGVEAPSCGH